ncbi:MAG: hypothetical protein AAGA21_13875 [Pseudomonadota bacterium]
MESLDNFQTSFGGQIRSLDEPDEKRSGAQALELVGIVIAVIAALFVLFHARFRQLSLLAAICWSVCTFLLFIIVFPVYLLIHGPEPKRQENDV